MDEAMTVGVPVLVLANEQNVAGVWKFEDSVKNSRLQVQQSNSWHITWVYSHSGEGPYEGDVRFVEMVEKS